MRLDTHFLSHPSSRPLPVSYIVRHPELDRFAPVSPKGNCAYGKCEWRLPVPERWVRTVSEPIGMTAKRKTVADRTLCLLRAYARRAENTKRVPHGVVSEPKYADENTSRTCGEDEVEDEGGEHRLCCHRAAAPRTRRKHHGYPLRIELESHLWTSTVSGRHIRQSRMTHPIRHRDEYCQVVEECR